MAQEVPGQTLQTTPIVYEANIRLVDVEKAQHWIMARPCWHMSFAVVMAARPGRRTDGAVA